MFNIFKNLIKKPIFPYLETSLVTHCNLKCNHCCNMCDYIDEEIFVDIEEYKKDLLELTRKVDIKQFRILGGEPLLHPNVIEIIKETRKLLPNSEINLGTNGILLPSMKQEFWTTLKENNIIIDLSLYPIWGDNPKKIPDLIKSHYIKYNVKPTNNFIVLFNPQGTSNQDRAFKMCYSKQCINLWNHKLYQCDRLFRYYYNKKFNTDISTPFGYDIYKHSGKTLYNKLYKNKKSFDACRYCNDKIIIKKWSNTKINQQVE